MKGTKKEGVSPPIMRHDETPLLLLDFLIIDGVDVFNNDRSGKKRGKNKKNFKRKLSSSSLGLKAHRHRLPLNALPKSIYAPNEKAPPAIYLSILSILLATLALVFRLVLMIFSPTKRERINFPADIILFDSTELNSAFLC